MIEVKNLSKRLKDVTVLNEVDLKIASGERVALVGANGAGKTSLIRCLLGEYTSNGEVRIDGRSPRIERAAVLRGIGFVPQLPPPLGYPVAQLVRFAADVSLTQPAEIEGVADRLGLELQTVRHRPFAKLSGGQKQKLLIAIALGRPSRTLLFDEPAANLDPEARRAFLEMLEARSSDSTMLISSHRLDELSALVHRVIELDRGRIVVDRDVREKTAHSDVDSARED